MSVEFDNFVKRYRLRIALDDCHDRIVKGRFGHIYTHGSGLLGLLFEARAADLALDNTVRARRRAALRAGFQRHQWGDAEAILLFDPANDTQARLAIKLIAAKRKRVSSPAQLKNLRRGPDRKPHSGQEPARGAAVDPRVPELRKKRPGARLSEGGPSPPAGRSE